MRLHWLIGIVSPLIIGLCNVVTPQANADPLLTISCDQPKGVSIAYGVSLTELVEADQKKQPEPPPTLKAPTKDGFVAKPTFVIDANKRRVTVIWAESPEDAELRKQAEKLKLPISPPSPAREATVVQFLDDQISAIEPGPWSITTYSFFPKMGTAFIAQQAMSLGLKKATEIATFAYCQFSWSNPNDDPLHKN